MKTALPAAIATIEEAKAFLTNLHNNGESYHPEDCAHEVGVYQANTNNFIRTFSPSEADKLNELFEQIYNLEGNNSNHKNPIFDPCEFILSIDLDYQMMIKLDNQNSD